MRIEVLVDVKTTLGEGPLWDVEEQRLYWIDIAGKMIYRCADDGREIRAWDLPQKIGSMALRRSGGAVLSLALRRARSGSSTTGSLTFLWSDRPSSRRQSSSVKRLDPLKLHDTALEEVANLPRAGVIAMPEKSNDSRLGVAVPDLVSHAISPRRVRTRRVQAAHRRPSATP